MARKAAQARDEIWPTRVVEALSVLVLLFSLGGSFGAGQGWWGYQQGLQMLLIALVMAGIGAIMGVILMWRYRIKQPDIEGILTVCVLVCTLYIGYIAYNGWKAASLPAIHDVTTNSASPPQFRKLAERADNWRNIPGYDDPELMGLDARERWRKLHDEAYGDLRPARLMGRPDFIIRCAARLAVAEGWDIALDDPAGGRLEAVDEVSLFRFKDDVLVQATLVAGEDFVTRVDMRSVSRIGQSDIGNNAKRIRAFMAKLKAQCQDVD